MGALNTTVHIEDEGGYVVFGPGDDVPEYLARKIGAHCFEEDEHPYPDVDGDGETDRAFGEEPKRAGKGSGRDAWVSFASEKGLTVAEGTPRDQIIADLITDGAIEQSN